MMRRSKQLAQVSPPWVPQGALPSWPHLILIMSQRPLSQILSAGMWRFLTHEPLGGTHSDHSLLFWSYARLFSFKKNYSLTSSTLLMHIHFYTLGSGSLLESSLLRRLPLEKQWELVMKLCTVAKWKPGHPSCGSRNRCLHGAIPLPAQSDYLVVLLSLSSPLYRLGGKLL